MTNHGPDEGHGIKLTVTWSKPVENAFLRMRGQDLQCEVVHGSGLRCTDNNLAVGTADSVYVEFSGRGVTGSAQVRSDSSADPDPANNIAKTGG